MDPRRLGRCHPDLAIQTLLTAMPKQDRLAAEGPMLRYVARRASTSPPDLRLLKAAIDSAVVKSRMPPEAGMTSWPFTFPQQHLTRDEWLLLVSVVRYIRTHHRQVFKLYLYERTMIDLVVAYVQDLKRAPTMKQIVAELKRKAGAKTRWLVEVPLFNVLPPTEAVPLGRGAMLITADPRRDRKRWGRHFRDPWAVRRHFDDELTGHSRWLLSPRDDREDVDTRQTASLLLVEEGTAELAISQAETRAKYALAMWCLLAPPTRTKSWRPIWPTAGSWAPAPYLELGPIHKAYAPGRFPSTGRKGASISEYGAYRLTKSQNYLLAPFEAMHKAQSGNDCALALLSACRSLSLVAAFPSDLERTERVMHLWAAREALSERGRRGQGNPYQRWDRLVANLRLRGSLTRRGYVRSEVDEALEALHSLRNLATHKADDVLVNLNFPDHLTTQLRRATVGSNEVALSMIVAHLPVLYAAVRTAAVSLTRQAIAANWDERAFHRRFK